MRGWFIVSEEDDVLAHEVLEAVDHLRDGQGGDSRLDDFLEQNALFPRKRVISLAKTAFFYSNTHDTFISAKSQ